MTKPRKKRSTSLWLLRILIIAALSLSIFAAMMLGALVLALAPPAAERGIGQSPEGRLFVLERGEPAALIARRLEEEGFVRSALAFRILVKLRGQESSLKAGTYRIKAGMGARDIVSDLASGRQAQARLTIPEGYTLSQIAGLLEKAEVVSAEAFKALASDPAMLAELKVPAASLEGYLFPDTYYLPLRSDGREALKTMLRVFRKNLARIPEAAALSPEELHKKLILASIVEREYRLPEEAPVIAGIFLNRLTIGMALQSCATVVYLLTERLGRPHPELLFDRDIAIKDPYNSYINPGLPPGPICNPGMTALGAVFNPKASRYLYFRLVDPESGRHHFSLTLEEHIKNAPIPVKRTGG